MARKEMITLKNPKIVSTEGWVVFIPFEAVEAGKFYEDEEGNSYTFEPFVYDYITDNEIAAWVDKDLSDIDIVKEWQHDFDYAKGYAELPNEFHAKRIAKLVQEMQQGIPIKPVEMDIWYGQLGQFTKEPNFVYDGHHRIRACKYAGYEAFPACMGGCVKDFLELMGLT